jgi:hypothetical protein
VTRGYHELSHEDRVAAVLSCHFTDLPSVEEVETLAALDEGQGFPALLALARKGAAATQKTISSSGRGSVEWWSTSTPAAIHAALSHLDRARASRLFGPHREPPRAIVHSDGEGRFRVVDLGSEDFVDGELVGYPEGHNAAACSCEPCTAWRREDRVKAPNLSADGLDLEGTVACVLAVLARFEAASA